MSDIYADYNQVCDELAAAEERIAALEAARDEKTRCLDEAHRALRDTHIKLAEAQGERSGLLASIQVLQEQLAEAQTHSRNHHLEACETCAVIESDLIKARRERDEAYNEVKPLMNLAGERAVEIHALRARVAKCVEALRAYRDGFTAQTHVSSKGTKDVASIPRDVHNKLLAALDAEEGK